MDIKFCKKCPISKITDKRVLCTKCGERKIKTLDRFLPKGYMSLDEYYKDKEKAEKEGKK